MEDRRVHIVIPVFNHWDLCHELLWNLYRKESENIASILLVNDDSTDDEVAGGIKWWCSEFGQKYPISAVNIDDNLGFLHASNYGLMRTQMYALQGVEGYSQDDIVILLSTDVKVHGKFISQIRESIKESPKSLIGGIAYLQDTGWNKFDNQIFPYLEGWLLATTLKNWEELGYFDKQYSPSDFEDVDLSTTALALGYELVPLNNVGLQHLGGRSIGYSPEREEITKINQEKFRRKWVDNGT